MRPHPRERGSALLESTLVLLVFAVTLLETLDVGQFIFFQAMLMDRARAGARYAQVNSFDASAVANMVVYNNSNGGTGAGLFGLNTAMVTVNRYDAGLSTDRVEVIISNFPLALRGPMLLANFSSRKFRVVMPSSGMGGTS